MPTLRRSRRQYRATGGRGRPCAVVVQRIETRPLRVTQITERQPNSGLSKSEHVLQRGSEVNEIVYVTAVDAQEVGWLYQTLSTSVQV
jgi:hypothetical protein